MSEQPIPPSIPEYQLLRLIGSGAYGEVWLARSVTGAYRAAKVVYRRRFEDERPLEREFRGLQKFEPISRMHSSQVAILHVGRTEDYFYYIMELADDASAESVAAPVKARSDSLSIRESASSHSERSDRAFTGAATYRPRTLKGELQIRGRLPIEECVRVSLLLTTALEHLHQNALIHRDIKPSNIIFVGGVPKLADIGLVTSRDATHSYVGTEGFVPPEGPGTPQADIYSLGKVLYEICTGRDRQDFPELPTQLREEQDREALVELNEIVLKACEHDPKNRYRSAEEMHADLALLQAGKSVRRARGIEKRLALFKRWAVAAALVALMAIGASYQSKRVERRALEQVHRLHVAQGVRLLNDGDSYGSVLWFAKALNLGYHDPIQEQINRVRIGTALRSAPRLSQIILHRDMIRRAVFSPNGQRVATASTDHTARIWDAATGEPIMPPLEHQDEVRDVEFSPDGRWLITASNDRTARVWDAATGKPISPPLQHDNYVYRATFHPNGSFVATASEDRTARIWSARNGELIGSPLKHDDRLSCVRFSNNGRWLATASRDGTARIWKIAVKEPLTLALSPSDGEREDLGEPEQQWPAGEGTSVRIPRDKISRMEPLNRSSRGEEALTSFATNRMSLLTSAATRFVGRVIVASDDANGNSIAIPTDRPVTILRHAGEVRDIAFSSDSRRLATASDDRTARVWNVETGEPLTAPLKHNDQIWCIAFSPDGRLVVTGSKDRTARIWDSTTSEAVTPPLQHGNNVRMVTFSSDGLWVATASSDQTARIWMVSDGSPVTPSLQHANNLESAAFNSAGDHLITASRDGSARVWDLRSLNAAELRIRSDSFSDRVAISPDGKRLLTRSVDTGPGKEMPDYPWKPALLWNLEDVQPSATRLRVNAQIGFIGFSPDGQFVIATSKGLIRLWDALTGKEVKRFVGHEGHAYCAAFSPDGRMLATGGGDSSPGGVWLWDITTDKLIASSQFPETVSQVAFGKEGRWLLVGWSSAKLDTGSAQVWDVATQRPLASPFHHRGQITQTVFSPDSRRVVTAFANETLGPCEVQVWNPLTGQPSAPPIKHRDGVLAASFSPDGKWIVTASEDRTARVWNSFTSEARTPPLRHNGQVQWAEFSPNGRLVLTASMDNTARVWDSSTGQPVTSPLQHQGPVRHAVFSKDGHFIVTTSEDRTTRVWKLSLDERPATELLHLAELLAAQRIDATDGLVPLETDEIRTLWKSQH